MIYCDAQALTKGGTLNQAFKCCRVCETGGLEFGCLDWECRVEMGEQLQGAGHQRVAPITWERCVDI